MSSLNNVERLRVIFSDLADIDADGQSVDIDPLTYRDAEGDSLLHIAAIRGNIEATSLLIEIGADINARGDMGCTPLHYAAKSRRREVFDALLSAGGDAEVMDAFGFFSGDYSRGRNA